MEHSSTGTVTLDCEPPHTAGSDGGLAQVWFTNHKLGPCDESGQDKKRLARLLLDAVAACSHLRLRADFRTRYARLDQRGEFLEDRIGVKQAFKLRG